MSQTKNHCEPLVAVWLKPSTTEPCICCKQVAEKPRGEHLKNDFFCACVSRLKSSRDSGFLRFQNCWKCIEIVNPTITTFFLYHFEFFTIPSGGPFWLLGRGVRAPPAHPAAYGPGFCKHNKSSFDLNRIRRLTPILKAELKRRAKIEFNFRQFYKLFIIHLLCVTKQLVYLCNFQVKTLMFKKRRKRNILLQ